MDNNCLKFCQLQTAFSPFWSKYLLFPNTLGKVIHQWPLKKLKFHRMFGKAFSRMDR